MAETDAAQVEAEQIKSVYRLYNHLLILVEFQNKTQPLTVVKVWITSILTICFTRFSFENFFTPTTSSQSFALLIVYGTSHQDPSGIKR